MTAEMRSQALAWFLERGPLWLAINAYAETCSGTAAEATISEARESAVTAVEHELQALISKAAANGFRAAVCHVADVLGLGLSPEQEAALERMDADELQTLVQRLKRDRRWE